MDTLLDWGYLTDLTIIGGGWLLLLWLINPLPNVYKAENKKIGE